MSFFERFPEDPEPPEPEQEIEPIAPEWFGPADDELPASVPADLVLGRSDRAFVAISHWLAHSTGVSIELRAAARGLTHHERMHVGIQSLHRGPGADDASDGLLRLGIEFSDGRRASNLGAGGVFGSNWQTRPGGPRLVPHGGSGGGGASLCLRQTYWLWPLPPPGPLTVVCEWAALGIALSSVTVDAGALVAAAERATRLWD